MMTMMSSHITFAAWSLSLIVNDQGWFVCLFRFRVQSSRATVCMCVCLRFFFFCGYVQKLWESQTVSFGSFFLAIFFKNIGRRLCAVRRHIVLIDQFFVLFCHGQLVKMRRARSYLLLWFFRNTTRSQTLSFSRRSSDAIDSNPISAGTS